MDKGGWKTLAIILLFLLIMETGLIILAVSIASVESRLEEECHNHCWNNYNGGSYYYDYGGSCGCYVDNNLVEQLIIGA